MIRILKNEININLILEHTKNVVCPYCTQKCLVTLVSIPCMLVVTLLTEGCMAPRPGVFA